jgi:serine/threonine protein kinase
VGEAHTAEPGLFGTIDYIAPEQIRGGDIDGRADVYALGCLLYECLAGKPPFRRGSDAATLYAHLEEPPPTLRELEEVLSKALAKDPAERFQTCAELIEATRAPQAQQAAPEPLARGRGCCRPGSPRGRTSRLLPGAQWPYGFPHRRQPCSDRPDHEPTEGDDSGRHPPIVGLGIAGRCLDRRPSRQRARESEPTDAGRGPRSLQTALRRTSRHIGARSTSRRTALPSSPGM